VIDPGFIGDLERLCVSTEGHEVAAIIVESFQVGPWACKPIRSRSHHCARADCAHLNPPSIQILDLLIPPFGLC